MVRSHEIKPLDMSLELFISVFLAAALLTMCAMLATSQDTVSPSTQDVKHIQTTLPNSRNWVRFAALSVSRDWTESVVHLRGNVQVEMSESSKPTSHQVIILKADAVEYHEKTGEIDPYGNVRLTVEDLK